MIKRPAIPWRVTLAAALDQIMRQTGHFLVCPETGAAITPEDCLAGNVERDHNPPLSQRRYDEKTGDYDPPANDYNYLEILTKEGHAIRTNKLRGLHRGDKTQLKHDRRLNRKEDAHKRAMAAKMDLPTIAEEGFDPSDVRKAARKGTPTRHWPIKSRKLQSRGFPKKGKS